MSIKFLCGFEHQSRADSGFTALINDNAVSDTSTPAQSKGNRSLRHFSSVLGIYTAPLSGNVQECYVGSMVRGDSAASDMLAGISLGTTDRYVEAGFINGQWVIYINGSSVATVGGFSITDWHRLHLHVSGLSALDVVTLYKDGDLTAPLLSHTLTSGEVAGWPASFSHVCFVGQSQGYIDDLWVMDPTDSTGTIDPQETLSFSVELLSPDADGSDFTFATGSFADVDEIPFDLADKITADAVGQIADLSLTAATAAQVVGAMKITLRTQRSGTTAGSQIELSLDDNTSNNVITTTTVPGDGMIEAYTETSADGTRIEVSKINLSTIQGKTVT